MNDPFAVSGNPDFWRNLMQFGFSTMASGAKPGATTLGALGEGGIAASESARQNALARAQSEYYGQNTLNKQLENQAALYDMNLDRRGRGEPALGDNLTPLMNTASPSMPRTPNVGQSPVQGGTEVRPSSSASSPEDLLVRIARGNVEPRNAEEAAAALAWAKSGSPREKYLQNWLDAKLFTGEKAKATLPYEMKKIHASATAGDEAKIRRIQQTMGVDRKTAVGFVDGTIKLVTDPDTDTQIMVNLLDGTSSPISTGQTAPSASYEPMGGRPMEKTSLYEKADISTGPASGLREYYSYWTALDPTGLLPVADETISARTQLKAESMQLVKQLQNNPRYSNDERRAIADEIGIEPGFFQSPEMLRAHMKGVAKSLTDKMRKAERDSQDRTVSKEVRQFARRDASAIRDFLIKLDVPGYNPAQPRASVPVSKGGMLDRIWLSSGGLSIGGGNGNNP